MREMKDSGVEWIRDIPVDWELSKIGAVYEERNVKVSDNDYVPLSVTKKGIVPQLETAAKTDNGDNRKLIKKNDFVINSRSDRRGSCGISKFDGSCSLINTVLKPRKNMHNAYYDFVFHSDLFADEFYAWGNGIVDDLWSTKWSSMKRIYIPAPPIDEQIKIADYLDDKCSKVDVIIAKQEKIIEKLKEYRVSVITEKVTRGLNGSQKLKNSGLDWAGLIPDNWVVTKINRIGQTTSGATPLRNKDEEYFHDAKIRWVRTLDLNDWFVYESSEKITEVALKNSSCSIMPIDTVCVAMYGGGGTIGKCGLLKSNAATNQAVCSIIVYSQVVPEYLLFQLMALKRFWMKYAVGTRKDPNISQETVRKMQVLVPSFEEQREIVNFLIPFCESIDKQVACREQLISKLTEYKKSLIYECVTGKKEVC